MNPLLNEQLGQSTHHEYETKYSRQYSSKYDDKVQTTFAGWQKLALAAGSIAMLIILASLALTS